VLLERQSHPSRIRLDGQLGGTWPGREDAVAKQPAEGEHLARNLGTRHGLVAQPRQFQLLALGPQLLT